MFKPSKLASTLVAAFAYVAVDAHDADAAPKAAPVLTDSMSMGGLTNQPIGHHKFCRQPQYKAECDVRSYNTGPMPLTGQRWEQLMAVNEEVNARVRALPDDPAVNGGEVWDYPVNNVGDCEDYALEKRQWLLGMGWNESQLLITVVRQNNGQGHAILTARTDEGDYILDNLDMRVRRWDQVARTAENVNGYHFLKRQAEQYTGSWRTIQHDMNTHVATTSAPAAP